MIKAYINSSIGKKQIVAISGLAMVLFLIAHLSGNFLMFKGPEALNDYSDFLHSLGGLLWVARIGLLGAFLLHFIFIIRLILENRAARKNRYEVDIHSETRSLATKTMRYSAIIIFVYIGWHLYDYTFTASSPVNATVNGEYLGLYGLVYNSFLNPIRSIFYIVAMIAIGMHLTHGIQSVAQSFGIRNKTYENIINKTSIILGAGIAVGFSSIPIYVWVIS